MEDVKKKPRFTAEQAEQVAAQTFRLYGTASALPSERDQNFLIETPSGNYVLKIANPETALEVLELENQAIRIAHAIDDFESPQIVKSADNHSIIPLTEAGQCWHVRCLTYLPGTPLASFPNHTPELLSELGRCLGLLDGQLQTLDQNRVARRQHRWDLTRAPESIKRALQAKPESDRQDLLLYFLSLYESIAPRLPALKQSVIHNDANNYNVIVAVDPVDETATIGLIDFGDLLHSRTIHDLAICAAYVMLDKANPLQALAAVTGGYHRSYRLNDAEISCLFPLACLRLAQSVSISIEQQRRDPENEYLAISEKPAWQTLKQLSEIEPGEVRERLWDTCHHQVGRPVGRDAWTAKEIIASRRRYVAPSLSLSYDQPIKIVKGQGQYLYDQDDMTYLDCVNNVCHVGHCHPNVVEAASGQISTLNTNTRYLHPNIVSYAEQLSGTLPDSLSVCFFVNSGSEANDLALRLAQNFTGQRDMFVIDHAYHGHTSALIDVSPYKFQGPGGPGKPEHVHVLDLPDLYRGKYRSPQEDAVSRYVADARANIESVTSNGGIAGLIAESLLSCGGQIPLPPGYLAAVYQSIHQAGGICIADEVQVGFGRVGSSFWGFELSGVQPDIVTLGKPIGNGHPLAAVVTTREIADAFHNGMEYFNTFGGNPVSCAVGMAVLDVIQKENLQQNALQVGNYLLLQLRELPPRFPRVGDVRGSGLFLGIEIVKDLASREPDARAAKQIVERMKQQRILLSTDGPDHNVIKFKPPMVFDMANAERLVDNLKKVLADLDQSPASG
ncbi:MAG: aminotransferase class III-fold pyridoxal phosphate-dependent enzyme [Mariniblastus sp.]|nr:aminotransferase class III-fold pyridoxal phosphate-dependent enzyme [Mariniblastus sp.]